MQVLGIVGFIGMVVYALKFLKNLFQKKSKKKAVIGFFVCLFLLMFAAEWMADENPGTDTPNENTVETTKQETKPTTAKASLFDKFVSLGFTSEEAEEMKEIFYTVGITEIGDVKNPDQTIDSLVSYVAPIYDSQQLQVIFTVENRELCYVELTGVSGTQPKFYVNFWGNLKVKEEQTKKSFVLFERWIDDTDYHQPIEDSYRIKLDWENKELVELKENGMK